MFLSYLHHGGHGSISPAANVFPKLMVRLYEEFRSGNLKEAARISDVFAPLRAAWALGSFPVVIKEGMALVGKSAGPTRPPIQPLSDEARQELKQVLDRIALAETELKPAASVEA
jgi:4-hydroxy-tetrahydrodipicolinate synthase